MAKNLLHCETDFGVYRCGQLGHIFVKNPETCPHFGAYGFCISAPGISQPPLTFFSNGRVCQITPHLKDYFAKNTTVYLFREYFQSLRAKK
jgi:hypothetical protein